MVGHKFIEALKEKDPDNKFNVVTFCEENRAAYNRMRLTEVSCGSFPQNKTVSCLLDHGNNTDRVPLYSCFPAARADSLKKKRAMCSSIINYCNCSPAFNYLCPSGQREVWLNAHLRVSRTEYGRPVVILLFWLWL